MKIYDVRLHQKTLHAVYETIKPLVEYYNTLSPKIENHIDIENGCFNIYDIYNNTIVFQFRTVCKDETGGLSFTIAFNNRDCQDVNYFSWLLAHIDQGLYSQYHQLTGEAPIGFQSVYGYDEFRRLAQKIRADLQ